MHAWFFARKPDADHLVREGVDVVSWRSFCVNPLLPLSRKIPVEEHAASFAKAVCGLFGNLYRGVAILLLALHVLYDAFKVTGNWTRWDWPTMRAPCLVDLVEVLKSKSFRSRVHAGLGTQSLWSLIDKLESLVLQLGPVVRYQRGFNFRRLYADRRAVVLNLAGLPVEAQNFLILMLFVQYYDFFRVSGPWNQLNLLFFVDESKGLFGKGNRDLFLLKDMFAMCREFGIGFVIADQIPSELAQFVWSNLSVVVAFRHSDGTDQRTVANAIGMTREQRDTNYALQPGEAIVRTRRCRDLHLVQVPTVTGEKFIRAEERDRLMAERLAELGRYVIPAAPVESEEADADAATEDVSRLERRFLECLAVEFAVPSSEIYRRAGLGNSGGYRVKRRLLARGFIAEVETNLGRGGTRCVFLVPDAEVLARFGIVLGRGRGGVLHRHLQEGIRAEAEHLGFVAVIEDCRGGSGAAPDVGLEKNGLRVAVEVAVTSKPSQEVRHVDKNLRLGFDRVVLSFVNRRVLERTRQLAASRYSADVLARVTFCLVNEWGTALGEV